MGLKAYQGVQEVSNIGFIMVYAVKARYQPSLVSSPSHQFNSFATTDFVVNMMFSI